jgi:hypothetical protein
MRRKWDAASGDLPAVAQLKCDQLRADQEHKAAAVTGAAAAAVTIFAVS